MGPQPAFASRSCAAEALDARASQQSPPAAAPRPPAYAADGSAAAAQPVWDLAAADNGGIKQAPQDTSELLPFSTAERLSSAQTRVCAWTLVAQRLGYRDHLVAEHLPIFSLQHERMLITTSDLSCCKCDKQALELNTRIQQQNAAPVGFPAFVREGFNVKVSRFLS